MHPYGFNTSKKLYIKENELVDQHGEKYAKKYQNLDSIKAKAYFDAFPSDNEFKVTSIDKNTLLMRFPSFDFDSKLIIDSILKKYDEMLRNTPNLIIDIRGNPGGTIKSTFELVKYINTSKIHYISSYYVATDTTISLTKSYCEEYKQSVTDSNYYCNYLLPLLQANKGKLVLDTMEEYIENALPIKYPEKVAILADENTASAAELFIIAAKGSKKVKTFGCNTSAAVDFGGVVSYFLSNRQYIILMPTEMSENIKEVRYDYIGIEPDYKLSPNRKNWINEVTFIINEK
jgi:C-terminal processing protease CtpA/Prc